MNRQSISGQMGNPQMAPNKQVHMPPGMQPQSPNQQQKMQAEYQAYLQQIMDDLRRNRGPNLTPELVESAKAQAHNLAQQWMIQRQAQAQRLALQQQQQHGVAGPQAGLSKSYSSPWLIFATAHQRTAVSGTVSTYNENLPTTTKIVSSAASTNIPSSSEIFDARVRTNLTFKGTKPSQREIQGYMEAIIDYQNKLRLVTEADLEKSAQEHEKVLASMGNCMDDVEMEELW